MNTIGDGL